MATRAMPRLFVGNIPWTVGNKELRDYFSQFGMVTFSRVIFDKSTGFSRGFGFLQFASNEAYSNAVNRSLHVIDGGLLTIQPSN